MESKEAHTISEEDAKEILFEHYRNDGPPPLPRMKDEDLKKFVQDYVANQIFTSHDAQKRNADLGMVFMPLMMGAFEPPEGLYDRPEYPNEPKRVDALELPEPPKEPLPPLPLKEALEALEALKEEVAYDRAAPDKLNALQTHLDEKVSEDRKEFEAALEQHRIALVEHESECVRLQTEHEESVEAYKQEVLAFDKAMEDYEKDEEVYQAKREAWVTAQMKDVGVVWEYLNKSLPRGVNGNPMFMSCRIMHKEDWKRATKALDKIFADLEEVRV